MKCEVFTKGDFMDQDQELKRFGARITELAERSLRQGQPEWTDFLDPTLREEAQAILGWIKGIRFSAFGGYPGAERKRLAIYPDYYISQAIEPELAYLAITVNQRQPGELNHRDYLGALMNLGIKREKIGDLLVTEEGCQAILAPELVEFIKQNLTKIGNYKAGVVEIEPEQLNIPNLREKILRSTVASLRLDAIAALGFGESRTKMVKEIKANRVKVNWKPVLDPDLDLNPGDVISIRGRGRVIFKEVSGKSKKGRLGVELVRLL
ncbi:MAG: photosystem II S4 domain protein [Firmicutes bacterium]|nr:photosystem II S4 domain protein [Bacillota bacterium]